MEMQDCLNIEFLKKLNCLNISPGDLTINGFSYPISQQNGQKSVGPVRDSIDQVFVLDKPKENENEIFLDKIPSIWTETVLMKYLMQAGIVYLLRFMVRFSGHSRGIAYVQFLGNCPSILMAERLNKVFRHYQLRTKARVSQNFRQLKIGNISMNVPDGCILMLFKQCNCIESRLIGIDSTKTFIVAFADNRRACLARRFLLSHSEILGSNIYVVWFDKPKRKF